MLHKNALKAYTTVEQDCRVEGADRHQLVEILFTELLGSLDRALLAIKTGDRVVRSRAQIKALTTAQFQNLTTQQLKGLTTEQMAAMETEDLRALTTAQIRGLATDQLNALSSDQIASLTTAQVAALGTSAIAALEKAVELEPNNAVARGQLEQLKSYRKR